MKDKPIQYEAITGNTLTRDEYLRLLLTARSMGRYRLYLLIKLFSFADIPASCLAKVTVETIKEGIIPGKERQSFPCPAFLQEELLDYAELKGIQRGSIFVTRNGAPLDRSNIYRELNSLAKYAHIPPEKISIRTLNALYQCMQTAISDQANALAKAAYSHLLATEQNIIGWDKGMEIPGRSNILFK